MLNCGLDEKEKIFNKCKSLVDAVGKSKRDGSGADNWNLAVSYLQFISNLIAKKILNLPFNQSIKQTNKKLKFYKTFSNKLSVQFNSHNSLRRNTSTDFCLCFIFKKWVCHQLQGSKSTEMRGEELREISSSS